MKSILNALGIIILIGAVVLGVLYFQDQASNTEEPVEVQEQVFKPTKEYLVSTDWGPQKGTLGAYINFNADGTFESNFQGETDGMSPSGTFKISGNALSLDNTHFGSFTPDEVEEKFGYTPIGIETITFHTTDESLHFTKYLEADTGAKYWDPNSPVEEGSIRNVDGYEIDITNNNQILKDGATAKALPVVGSDEYTFDLLDDQQTLVADVFNGVIGSYEDWFLIDISLNWYGSAVLNGDTMKISYAWVHESELE